MSLRLNNVCVYVFLCLGLGLGLSLVGCVKDPLDKFHDKTLELAGLTKLESNELIGQRKAVHAIFSGTLSSNYQVARSKDFFLEDVRFLASAYHEINLSWVESDGPVKCRAESGHLKKTGFYGLVDFRLIDDKCHFLVFDSQEINSVAGKTPMIFTLYEVVETE